VVMKMEVSDLRHYHILLLLTHMRTTSLHFIASMFWVPHYVYYESN